MKKYLLSIAALLLGLLAHSQEADELGNYAEFSIIPRLDLNPGWYTSSDEFGFDLGNSSLYTLFEGTASEHFSWTLANHWIALPSFDWFREETGALYKGIGYSDTNNLFDFAKVDLTFGSWTFTLGQDCMAIGGHEYDDWDWEVHPMLASPLWNELPCYQWGGKVAWTTPSELSTFSLQMTTSPFGERPFGSGLWAYSAQWGGEYDWFSPLWSVSAVGIDRGEYNWLVTLGNQFLFGDWTFTLDWTNTCGLDAEYSSILGGHTFHGRLDYAPSERWDLSLRGNYVVTDKSILMDNWWNLGTAVEFFPLRDNQDLRLHAVAEYDTLMEGLYFSFGILYNLRLNLW